MTKPTTTTRERGKKSSKILRNKMGEFVCECVYVQCTHVPPADVYNRSNSLHQLAIDSISPSCHSLASHALALWYVCVFFLSFMCVYPLYSRTLYLLSVACLPISTRTVINLRYTYWLKCTRAKFICAIMKKSKCDNTNYICECIDIAIWCYVNLHTGHIDIHSYVPWLLIILPLIYKKPKHLLIWEWAEDRDGTMYLTEMRVIPIFALTIIITFRNVTSWCSKSYFARKYINC